MNVVELQRALRQLRCSGIAAGLEVRLLEAQAEKLAAIDFLSRLVQDELVRRQDRLLERRLKQAGFRDAAKRLDTFDFDFNKKMNRALVFELATARWVTQHADALFLGPPGTGKSHVAQAIGFAAIQQGHRVLYREAHVLVEDLAEAQLAGTRKDYVAFVTTVPMIIESVIAERVSPPITSSAESGVTKYPSWIPRARSSTRMMPPASMATKKRARAMTPGRRYCMKSRWP